MRKYILIIVAYLVAIAGCTSAYAQKISLDEAKELYKAEKYCVFVHTSN